MKIIKKATTTTIDQLYYNSTRKTPFKTRFQLLQTLFNNNKFNGKTNVCELNYKNCKSKCFIFNLSILEDYVNW